MNAIISLCHFCEIHGPSVICCTQAFHSPEPEQLSDDTEELTLVGQTKDGQRTPPKSWDCLQDWNADRKATTTSKSAPSSPTSLSPDKTKSDSCEACSPFCSVRPGFISRDQESGVCYVTTHEPRSREVYSIVRQACVRSLSCEMCPGREGPIFFGDDHRSQVLGHAFNIKDSYARGFERLFSITVVMMDKIFLLNSWPFLVKHIQQVIEYVKSRAAVVYEDEIARCPQRMHRIPTGCTPTSQNYRLQRGSGVKATRSLVELTNDAQVFERLHRAFTWMLRAGGSRLTEKLLEGPVIDGSIVDDNRVEETEDGFIKVFSQKKVTVDQTVYRDVNLHDNASPFTMTQRFKQLRLLAKVVGAADLHVITHNILIGNQVVVRCQLKRVIRSILDSLQILLPRGCCRTIYYSNEYIPSYTVNFLGVGERVKVPVDTALCVLIEVSQRHYGSFDALGLPYTDSHTIDTSGVPYSDSQTIDTCGVPYTDSQTIDTCGAPYTDSHTIDTYGEPYTDSQTIDTCGAPYSDSQTIDTYGEPYSNSMDISSSGPHSILQLTADSDRLIDFSQFTFDVKCCLKDLLTKEPTLLENIEKTLLHDKLADVVLEQSLICLKEDWMNKVKRWFMFNKVGSSRNKEDMDRLMQVLKVKDCDKMLLKFWMSGLSVEYRLTTNST